MIKGGNRIGRLLKGHFLENVPAGRMEEVKKVEPSSHINKPMPNFPALNWKTIN